MVEQESPSLGAASKSFCISAVLWTDISFHFEVSYSGKRCFALQTEQHLIQLHLSYVKTHPCLSSCSIYNTYILVLHNMRYATAYLHISHTVSLMPVCTINAVLSVI